MKSRGVSDTSNSIRILFFADTHLGFDYPVRPRSDRNRRGEDFFQNFDKVLQFGEDHKVDLAIHGGDVFHTPKVPEVVTSRTYERIFEFADHDIPIVICPGNHERSTLPPSLFLQHNNIRIFTKPETFKFNIKGVPVSIGGFPFIRGNIRDEFPSILADLETKNDPDGINLFCMHQAVQGSAVGPQNFTFGEAEDVVQMDDLAGSFHAFLSGHIHREQILWTEEKMNGKPVPMIYPGSTERTSFAEMDEQKGFYILEFEIGEALPTLEDMHFEKLYARPMMSVDLGVRPYTPDVLRNEIQKAVAEMDANSVLRFKAENQVTLAMLSSSFLKEVVPSTMNVSVTGFPNRYRSQRGKK